MAIRALLAFFILFSGLIGHARGDAGPGDEGRYSLELSAAYHQSLWFPGYYRGMFKFRTEGLQSATAKATVFSGGRELLTASYERPVAETGTQQAMLNANSSRNAGIQRLTFILQPGALMGDGGKAGNFWLALLTSLEIETTRELFFGTAEAEKDFVYAPRGTEVTWTSDTTVTFNPPLNAVAAGGKLSFQTEFSDLAASFYWPRSAPDRWFDFGAGYFENRWLRPSDYDRNWRTVTDDLPIVYESTFRSRGVQLTMKAADPGRPGLGISAVGRWGLNNSVSNALQRNVRLAADQRLLYASLAVSGWYRWYQRPAERKGWTLSAGALFDRRYFGTEIHPFKGGVEIDDLWKLSVEAGYRF